MTSLPNPEGSPNSVSVSAPVVASAAAFKIRVACVWSTLLVLFALFFTSFDLKFSIIAEKFPMLAGLQLSPEGFLQGAALTLFVCAAAIIASVILGTLAALGRMSHSAVLYGIATFYTSFFRGTPLLVQILLIYIGLPQIGPVPEAIPAGIIALSLNYGAYLSEIFRAGFLSVPKGQHEAACALGLPRWLIFWKIIVPQAMRFVIPPTGTQFIAMLKDSSLISVMGVWEIMFLAQSFGRSTYRYIEMLTAAALIYWAMSLVFELLQSRIEAYYGRGYKRSS